MSISRSISTTASIHHVMPAPQHFGADNESAESRLPVSSDYWWGVDSKNEVFEPIIQHYVPSAWDEEEEEKEKEEKVVVKPSLPPKSEPKKSHSAAKNADDESDAESSDDDDGDEDDGNVAAKISRHQKMQNLCDELLKHVSRFRAAIAKQPYAITRKGFTTQNLINETYNIPEFGNFFILLLRSQAFFQAQGQLKVNISKLRQDISTTTTHLRGAILQHDDALQEKYLEKLAEQKASLQEAERTINQIKEKNTPLDKVRAALRIIKRGNERAVRFTTMFRNCVCPPEQTIAVAPVVEIKAVAVSKKDSKTSSLFAMKSLKKQ